MQERPTFSPFWHRVRAMKPRLRPHVQITRQFYRGQRWHVVHDPSSNQFYRLNPVAYEFVGLLDGRRTVEEVWELSLTRHGDAAPTQHEAIQLISQLYSSNLLVVEGVPDVDQLLRRGKERRGKQLKQQAIGLMYFKMRMFNPDRILDWLEPIMRPILNRWGLLAWAALVIAALVAILPHFSELAGNVEAAIAPSNWVWLIVVFVVTKLIHETGHGVICKRFDGQVPELGIMLLVLFPAPYVDASSCWTFQSKWRRIAVGAGGMIFELAVAAVAAFVWLNTSREDLVNQLAYNAMLTASISTILFNANPLMRFDGYYILSDLLEMPNLMQRSTTMLKYLAQKHLYRIKDATAPSGAEEERPILVAYGLAALAYRIFLFITITLYVVGKMFAIGLFLAIWTAAAWFILPVGSFIHWHATNTKIADFRVRAALTSVALILLVGGLLGVVPWPDHRRGDGVILSSDRAGLFAGGDGFVRVVHKRPGDLVRKGELIVECESPQLESQLRMLSAQIAETEALEREATARDPAEAQIARERLRMIREQYRTLSEKYDRLNVVAPYDGVIVGEDPMLLAGSFVREGTRLCGIADPSRLFVTATLSQAEALWLFELPREDYTVEMRLRSNVAVVFTGGNVRVIDAGQRDLPHPSLGFAGAGTIEIDTRDQSGLLARQPQFEVIVEPATDPALAAAWQGLPGERVKLRFTLPNRPLIAQWIDSLHKLVQGKVNL